MLFIDTRGTLVETNCEKTRKNLEIRRDIYKFEKPI